MTTTTPSLVQSSNGIDNTFSIFDYRGVVEELKSIGTLAGLLIFGSVSST